jgi:phosphoserine phosphatase
MSEDPLPGWNASGTKQAIVEFVAAVTDPTSPDFVPEIDRIAVFDNDGTLATEMPLYTQLAFALARSADLGQPISIEDLKAGGLGKVVELVALTHGSITTDEFDRVCRNWMATAHHPLSGRPFSEMVYQPMLELLALLGANGFSCWIFSGGGADFMRTWATEVYGLAPHRLIGSLGSTTFEVGDDGPELRKGTDIQVLDDGPQKPISIHQHVGQRPILAAGNTDGDLPMLQWTAAGPHRTLQLAVHHTDAEREYAYESDPLLGAGTDALLAAAAAPTWAVIDMATDWATIFPPARA